MAANNWPQALDMQAWMRQQERRTLHMERFPTVRTAADLMGPGLSAQAVPLLDWNDDATTFNGIFYSPPGAINSPDGALWWIGTTYATPDGYGIQRVHAFRATVMPPLTMVRTFAASTGIRTFTDWQPERPVYTAAATAANITGTARVDVPGMAVDITIPSSDAVLMVNVDMKWWHHGATAESVVTELWVDGVMNPVEILLACPLDNFRGAASHRYKVTGLAAGLREVKVMARLTAAGDWEVGPNSVLTVERVT